MGASKTRDIRDALISVIAPIQRDGEPAFTEVVGYPGDQFDSYPSVRVLPLDIDNQKSAFNQVDRHVAFTIRTYLPAKDDGSDFDQMYELTDLLIDSLDEADQSDALREQLGTYMLNTTRGSWDYFGDQSGVSLYADINVEVAYSQDL